MSLDYVYVAIYTAQVFVCVVGFIGLRRYKQLTLPLRILEWYIICSLIVDIVIDVMVHKKIHTYLMGQSFAVIELLLFSCIFYLWRTSKRNGFLIWAGFAVYLLIWIIGKFTFESFTGWDNYTEPIAQLIQIGFGGWILLRIYKRDKYCFEKRYSFLGSVRNSFICSSHILLFRIIYPNVDIKPKTAQSNLAVK